eukprot:8281239-Pyramimonas_sp.AAC.1
MPRISCQPVCIQEEMPTQAAAHLPAAPGTKYIMILRTAPRSRGDIQDRADKSSAMAGMNVFVLPLNILELFQNSIEGFDMELLFITDLILAGRVVGLLADFLLSSWDPAPRCKAKGGENRPLRNCDEPWGISA